MFDISFPELVVIAIVGLLVIGPDRLPEALRTLGLWIGRMRRSFTNVKTEIEREIGMDEIRRQLHNEAVMEEMKRIERNVRDSVSTGASRPGGTEPTTPSPPTSSSQDHDSEAGTPGDEMPGEQPPASHGQRTSSGDGGSQAQTPADDRSDDQRHG